MMSHFDFVQLRRMIGISPATPLASQEGQIRYARNGDADGVVYVARTRVGGAMEWGNLLTSNLASNLTATGADPTVTITPVGTYPGAGTTPTGLAVLGNDTAFRVSFTTGTGPATGLIFHVAFAVARASANYDVWFTPNTAAAEPVLLHTTSRATTGFDAVCSTTAPAASSAVGWGCFVVGY